ncbi:hypothetical protein Q9L58_003448 [Maublancomyces gigas]|uniref:Uncharacterized protein n=1 Tax=Discina gigas TaxID=1032678 RepID=A0ABR3GNS9_9PEZI
MSEETPASPDTTPISPIKERKNSLMHALKARPEEKDLKDRGILHTGAPAIQQVQHDLETAMAKDALKKHLSKRAEKDDLVQRASYLCQTSSGLYMGFANLAFEEY